MVIADFQKQYGIIGQSKSVRDIIDIIMQIAKSDISVLLFGESGVGKEVFAKAIHEYSSRAENQMISVNCGAIPEGILESELFGHKKGSFTGASADRKGYFEAADNGTLFLDEIAEMPLTTQVKLLRVLENHELIPVGSETVKKVDVRIIAAANKELQKEVDAKRFRKDLYFRLKAVTLTIPPLRERKEDIELLTNYFVDHYCENNKIPKPQITRDAYELLLAYSWPGNIRELKNTLETAVVLSKNGLITAISLRPMLTDFEELPYNRNLPVYLNKSPETLDRDMILRALFEIKKDILELKDLAFKNMDEANKHTNSNNYQVNEIVPIEELEKKAIENALVYTKFNKKEAAELLKISERTLYRKLKEYEIN